MNSQPAAFRRACALIALIPISFGLMACGNAPEPDPAPTGTAAPTPSPTPEPEPEPEILIPDCGTANPLAAEEYEEYLSQTPQTTAHAGDANLETFKQLAGPVAQSAMNEALETRGCYWPLYIAGNNIVQYTSVIPADVRDTLISSLRESDYAESSLNGMPVFTYAIEDPASYRMTGPTQVQYLFVENLWVSIFETGQSDYLLSAYDALIAVNPRFSDDSNTPG